jgi:hypothetical protein
MDYKDAPDILAFVLKTEEERIMMILQYDIYHRFTTAEERKSLIVADRLMSKSNSVNKKKSSFLDGVDVLHKET